MFALHGLNLRLQGFDGFFMRGYLLTQGDILPFLRFNLIASKKRTDAFGDVGCGSGRGPFQPFGLHFLFRTVQFLLCRRFSFLQFRYVGFQRIGHCLHLSVELLCVDMSCFGAFDTSLQSVFGHRLGIGILVLFQLDARHHLIGT